MVRLTHHKTLFDVFFCFLDNVLSSPNATRHNWCRNCCFSKIAYLYTGFGFCIILDVRPHQKSITMNWIENPRSTAQIHWVQRSKNYLWKISNYLKAINSHRRPLDLWWPICLTIQILLLFKSEHKVSTKWWSRKAAKWHAWSLVKECNLVPTVNTLRISIRVKFLACTLVCNFHKSTNKKE